MASPSRPRASPPTLRVPARIRYRASACLRATAVPGSRRAGDGRLRHISRRIPSLANQGSSGRSQSGPPMYRSFDASPFDAVTLTRFAVHFRRGPRRQDECVLEADQGLVLIEGAIPERGHYGISGFEKASVLVSESL